MNNKCFWLQVGLAPNFQLCLTDTPYSYYELVRFFSTICFIYFSNTYLKVGKAGLE